MEDAAIVQLYLDRDEDAIARSRDKYGRMLFGIALNILRMREDAEECENDTYFTAWNKIPPDRPGLLGAYLSKIVRYLSLNRRKAEDAQKRPKLMSVESELLECLPDTETPETALENGCLREAIGEFLRAQRQEDRIVFLRRYFYGDSLDKIAQRTGFSEGKIKSILHRLRIRLKERLAKEGLL